MDMNNPMHILHVRVVNKSDNPLPKYETTGAAGMDVRADIKGRTFKHLYNAYHTDDEVTILPGGRVLIPTGIHVQLPSGYELQVRPRSGLALKNGISIVNSPGTVDSDYTGDIGVILINHGTENFTVKHGDRIAQFVFAKYSTVSWSEVDELEETERNPEGFGTTGKN